MHFTHNGTKYVLRTDSEAVANAIVNSDEAKQCLAYLIMDSHVNFRLVKSKSMAELVGAPWNELVANMDRYMKCCLIVLKTVDPANPALHSS